MIVANGATVVAGTGAPPQPASATVTVPRAGLIPLLARLALPAGTQAAVRGDAAAVARLHGWMDRVQGIPEDE